jgi:hypothetical protein
LADTYADMTDIEGETGNVGRRRGNVAAYGTKLRTGGRDDSIHCAH